MTEPLPSAEILDVLIVGAGISGIGMAAHLRRKCPAKSFAILERRERPGGTWDLFRYPGVRSDSDMYTLGYGFAPWRGERAVARGDEILDYLDEVAEHHGLRKRMHFSMTVESADWDSAAACWTVRSRGAANTPVEHKARFLFAGARLLRLRHAAPGRNFRNERFEGTVLHPQFWPEDADYLGKRVIVIGSGATAVTIVPAMAERAAKVTMLQRTPSWYFAQPGRDGVALILQRILPGQWAYRLIRARNNALQYWFFRRSRTREKDVGAYLLARVEQELGERFAPADFTPPYGPWAQRLCFVPDGDLFAAIRDAKAEIVTGEIDHVGKSEIVLAGGRRLPADVIVTATGLKLAPLGGIALSRDGEPVIPGEHWYYRSCMFSNVPNFAALFGYLNAAWTLRVDLVADRLCRLFAQMDAWGADTVIPFLPVDHGLVQADPLAGFSSGYLARGRHLVPKSATVAPWRLSHDYYNDRREMREAPIDDGILRFSRGAASGRVAAARQLS